MKKLLIVLLILGFAVVPASADKAIFMVTWENGSPQIPTVDDADVPYEILGYSAMEAVTGEGRVRTQIEATTEELDRLMEDYPKRFWRAAFELVEKIEEGLEQ